MSKVNLQEFKEKIAAEKIAMYNMAIQAIEIARVVLPIFQAAYPTDEHPRKALECAENGDFATYADFTDMPRSYYTHAVQPVRHAAWVIGYACYIAYCAKHHTAGYKIAYNTLIGLIEYAASSSIGSAQEKELDTVLNKYNLVLSNMVRFKLDKYK